MIDVRHRRGRSRRREFLQVYCGRQARVSAVGIDRRRQQAVIEVREPATRLTQERWEWGHGRRRRIRDTIVVPASHHRLLVGMDESHLFICPLAEKAASVDEAHRKLRPPAVRDSGRSVRVRRQGEWFFVPVSRPRELAAIDEAVAAGLVERRAGIRAAGRPHRVDALLRLGLERQQATFARGAVRHPDHRVLVLRTWHAVHRNTEQVDARPAGMSWVD
jgi:hypothetical protein